MTISVVQSVENGATNSATITFTMTPTAGNTLAVVVAAFEPGGVNALPISVADSQGNTWKRAASAPDPINNMIAHGYYAQNVVGAATTLTVTFKAGSYIHGGMVEVAGLHPTNDILGPAAVNNLTDTSTPVIGPLTTATTAATTEANALIIGGVTVGGTNAGDTNISIDADATSTDFALEQDAWNAQAMRAAYRIVSSTGTQQMDFGNASVSGSTTVATLIFGLYETGTAPPPLQYVGGVSSGFVGGTGTGTVSLSGTLTGGLASSPAAGDLIVVAYSVGTAARTPTLTISGNQSGSYSQVAGSPLLSDDTYDTRLAVFAKIAGATPDTTLTRSATGNAADGGAIAVHVWRGVDATTPLDVTPTTATGINTSRPDAASITPTTADAVILVAAGGAASALTTAYTSSDLSSLVQATGADTNDARVGLGFYRWTSGAFNPASWGGGSNTTSDSWAAVTLALRPASTGGPLTGDAADTVSGTDAGTTSLVTAGVASDSTTAIDSGTGTTSLPVGGTDSVSADDGGTGLAVRLGIATDVLAATDGGSSAQVLGGVGTDTATSSDVGLVSQVMGAVGSDSPTATDSGTTGSVFGSAASDTVTGVDSSSSTATRLGVATDSAVASDASTGTSVLSVAASDVLIPTDSGISDLGSITHNVSGSDTLAAQDSSSSSLVITESVSDSAISAENSSAALTRFGAATDTASPSDSGQSDLGSVTHNASASDLATANDAASSTHGQLGVASDFVSAVDSASSSLGPVIHSVSAADTAAASDWVTAALVRFGLAADPVAPSDSGVAVRLISRPASDLVSPSDSALSAVLWGAAGADELQSSDLAQSSVVWLSSASDLLTAVDSAISYSSSVNPRVPAIPADARSISSGAVARSRAVPATPRSN